MGTFANKGPFSALQWGRSVNAAETNYIGLMDRRQAVLQWGRSVNAAETHWHSGWGHTLESCFNGAAALTLRKLEITGNAKLWGVASMGPQR